MAQPYMLPSNRRDKPTDDDPMLDKNLDRPRYSADPAGNFNPLTKKPRGNLQMNIPTPLDSLALSSDYEQMTPTPRQLGEFGGAGREVRGFDQNFVQGFDEKEAMIPGSYEQGTRDIYDRINTSEYMTNEGMTPTTYSRRLQTESAQSKMAQSPGTRERMIESGLISDGDGGGTTTAPPRRTLTEEEGKLVREKGIDISGMRDDETVQDYIDRNDDIRTAQGRRPAAIRAMREYRKNRGLLTGAASKYFTLAQQQTNKQVQAQLFAKAQELSLAASTLESPPDPDSLYGMVREERQAKREKLQAEERAAALAKEQGQVGHEREMEKQESKQGSEERVAASTDAKADEKRLSELDKHYADISKSLTPDEDELERIEVERKAIRSRRAKRRGEPVAASDKPVSVTKVDEAGQKAGGAGLLARGAKTMTEGVKGPKAPEPTVKKPTSTPTPSAPKIGEVRGAGNEFYRYKGGAPELKESWERVN